MDAIQLIRNDHRAIEQLFKAFERADRAGNARQQGELVRKIVRQLSIHAVVEEQFVYPALREAGEHDGVVNALEEHHAAKVTLAEIEALSPSSERFAPKVRLLISNVRDHVSEEEEELLPLLARALDDTQREQLAHTLSQAKRTAPTRPHPTAPDTPPGNFFVGAVAAIWDRGRDALRGGADVIAALTRRGARRSARTVTDLGRQAQARGRMALDGAAEAGEEAMDEVVELAGKARRRTRAAAGRVEDRSRAAARRVERTGDEAARRATQQTRSAARSVRKRTRATTRGYEGEPDQVH